MIKILPFIVKLFDDFKLIAVFHAMVNFPRTRMKTTSFLTGYVRSFYKGGFADLY
jgi:hypothetical protein